MKPETDEFTFGEFALVTLLGMSGGMALIFGLSRVFVADQWMMGGFSALAGLALLYAIDYV